jgi:hypothetical protein
MEATETVIAKTHRNVLSLHKKTLEFTKETHLTPRGDCIVAIKADSGMNDLSEEFKRILRTLGSRLEITIQCAELKDKVVAFGSPELILSHPTDMVVRKSGFICPRTLAIKADKSAYELDRKLVEKLGSEDDLEVVITLKAIA